MKPWPNRIRQHVDTWTQKCRKLNIKWWPSFAYHFTDVQNAASILTCGEILSRAQAQQRGLMRNDNAAADVISGTPSAYQRYARLYFRPRTPTQFHNEGIRAPRDRYHQAHCPVPVFFCFDLAKLLAEDDVEFSDGSLGRPEVRVGADQDLFDSIPFDLVYHDRGYRAGEDRSTITFHRHAEILVPERLTLTHLAGIACRSDAERRTLLHLLPTAQWPNWAPRIRCVGDPLFYRDRPHVDSVHGADGVLHVRFNAFSPGLPIRVRCRGQDNREWSWEGQLDSPSFSLRFVNMSDERPEIALYIHDCLAFCSRVNLQDELPF
ncbi:MAG: DUF4433 domain-containing protein [Myxococcales bacterium]|nr:DUF4433 domain-containing protein [Myxococcales bacterium]MCA9700448.1 DUF4433 domain-containing protein [Myxococcales bacterium]